MSIVQFVKKPDFASVYEDYYDRIYKYVYTILLHKENTEDIVAETFMAAYRNYDSYDPQKASISTWLTRIAHNNAVNLVRSAAYRTRADMPERDIHGAEDPALLQLEEDNDTVVKLYARLSADEREFLNMRYAMELKDAEIAQILGLQTKAVNKRYQRLLKKCRDIVAEIGVG
ncbi:MAG: RNA polymerase sigma factor [Eubacterium sp.]|nr:RNA polymerase sigma factor [Eubacterium sp.]